MPQRLEEDTKAADAVVEILAETPCGHFLLEVPVRRHDDLDVDRNLACRPEALNGAVLKDPQEQGLALGRELSDLVKEEDSAVSHPEQPLRLSDRSGEGSSRVSEQS